MKAIKHIVMQQTLQHIVLLAAMCGASPAFACTVNVAASAIGRTMMVTPRGEVTGIVPDFLALVAQDTGCRFRYQVVPRMRAIALFRKGDVDLIPASVRTPERDALGIFVHTFNTRLMLVALDGQLPNAMTRQELMSKHYALAVLRGYDYGPQYQAMLQEPGLKSQLSVVADPATAARMLAAGRFDAVLISPSVFVHAADTAGLTERITVTTLSDISFSPAGMYISIKGLNATDRDKLRTAIASLTARGEYARLVKQYHVTPKWAALSIEGAM